jgi:Flp pilus assembly protein TadD
VVFGTLAARQGNLLEGEKFFRQAIDIDSECATAWLSLGMILWNQEKQQEAWYAIRKAVEINPLDNEAVKIFRDIVTRMA